MLVFSCKKGSTIGFRVIQSRVTASTLKVIISYNTMSQSALSLVYHRSLPTVTLQLILTLLPSDTSCF